MDSPWSIPVERFNACSLSSKTRATATPATATALAHLERKGPKCRVSIDRIRAVMHHFQGEPGSRQSIALPRKLWAALQALDGYLTGQSDWLVNYAERHRAGLRAGTAITECRAARNVRFLGHEFSEAYSKPQTGWDAALGERPAFGRHDDRIVAPPVPLF
jgi:hypothetical protein